MDWVPVRRARIRSQRRQSEASRNQTVVTGRAISGASTADWRTCGRCTTSFARQGYEVTERSTVPSDLRESEEFRALCSTSATCMEKRLAPSTTVDPASVSAALALEGDPFYKSITKDFDSDPARRRAALTAYFSLSIEEGRERGRCVQGGDPAHGVAVWHLPRGSEDAGRFADEKRERLSHILGPVGFGNYCRIIDYMHSRAEHSVVPQAWYLSIVAVHPTKQGRGFGGELLAPTLAEAERHHRRLSRWFQDCLSRCRLDTTLTT